MKPRAPNPPFDQRTRPDGRTCIASLWPALERNYRRGSAFPMQRLTADFNPADAVSLGPGCYRVQAVPAQ